MPVVITATAEAELEAIGDYIAMDNPERALKFVATLRDACSGLADRPRAFAIVPRYAHLDVRKKIAGNYLIFYRAAGAVVEILHIVHGARDYQSFLFQDDEPK